MRSGSGALSTRGTNLYYCQNLNLTIIFYRCHLYTSFKVPYVGLQCVIVVHVFPDHTHLLFHILLVFSCCFFVVVFVQFRRA